VIRYVCPHCQRVCESAEVLRGFTVMCLGCRQSVRVPLDSTEAGEPAPASSPPALGHIAAPSLPAPAPLRPSVPPASPPAIKPLPVAPKSALPPPIADQPPPNRRLIWMVLTGAVAVLLVAGGFYLWRWYDKRKIEKARVAAAKEREDLKNRIADNFTPQALGKLAAKTPAWKSELAPTPRLRGKVVVLSFTETVEQPGPATDDAAKRLDAPKLIGELFAKGKVDELMFELPDVRWAEGAGEVDTVVGVRWRKEPAESPAGAYRWRASAILLDRKDARVTAIKEFLGSPPTSIAEGKKVAGPKPYDELRDWLLAAEAARPPQP
jgi:hypothetical protein